MRIAVAASPNDLKFAVIDFSNAASPGVVQANPGFGGPCVVDADGRHAAVGSVNGGDVTLYDLSVPASPAALGTIATGLVGIGCLSIEGMRVLAGEANGLRVTLIDFTTPAAPKLLSTINTGLSSLGSAALSGARAIAAGPNDPTLRIIDYSSPVSPSLTSFNPKIGGPLVSDLDGTRAVVGDQTGSIVKLVDMTVPAVLGTANTTLGGIAGVSIAGSLVAASSTNDTNIAIISFATPSSPSVKTFNPGLGGGATVFVGTELVVGAALGTTVKLFGLAGPTASLLGTANSGVSAIASIALTQFTPSGPPATPNIAVTPASLAFGQVAVCLSGTKTITIKNTGKATLSITGITATGPFTVTPGGATTVAPNGSRLVQVKFTPTVVGATTGVLTVRSNDPDTPNLSVTLQGTGTPTPPPKIEVTPASLYFGASLPKYFFGLRVTIGNTSPCTPLAVTGLSTGNPTFPITDNPVPATVPTTVALGGATIPPNGSRRYVVVFAPQSLGAFTGSLTITSNDPARSTVTVPLSGVCVLAKPTAASLALDRGDYLIFGAGADANEATLRAAVHLFLDLMPEEQGDYIGSVTNYAFHPAIRLTNIAPANPATKNGIRLMLPNVTPGGGGSNVGGMLIRAAQQVTADLKRLFPAAAPERRVVITFTGGREHSEPFISDAAPELLAEGIELYAVVVGTGTAMDAAALSQLAATSGGRFFAGDDLLLLRKNFVQVLADAFRMNMAADPIATIARGSTRDVRMRVTRCERRLRFVCAWEDFDERLGLELIAPDGTVFTPASPATNPLMRFGTRPGAAFYDLMLPSLDSDDVIGPEVIGWWVLRVSARGLHRGSERFTTALLVESDVSLRTSIEKTIVGAATELHVDVLHNGGPVAGAEVKVTVSAPLRSAQEVRIRELRAAAKAATRGPRVSRPILRGATPMPEPPAANGSGAGDPAGAAPPDAAVNLTEEALDGEDRAALIAEPIPPGLVESLAVPSIRIPYRARVIQAEPTSDFRYRVRLPRFIRDGIHQVTIRVRGPACGGILTRYLQFALAPLQHFDIDSSRFQLVREPGPGEPVMLRFTPRDAEGNLLGMGLRRAMRIVPPVGAVVVRTVDHFDGSYTILLARRRAAAGSSGSRSAGAPRWFTFLRALPVRRAWCERRPGGPIAELIRQMPTPSASCPCRNASLQPRLPPAGDLV